MLKTILDDGYPPEGPFVPLTEDVVTPKGWACGLHNR